MIAIVKSLVSLLERGFDVLNFSWVNLMVMAAIISIAAGGDWVWLTFALSLIFGVTCDELFSDYHGELVKRPQWYMESQLYLALPLLFVLTLISLNATASTPIPFVESSLRFVGFGSWSSRQAAHPLFVFVVVGFIYGMVGINVAHELSHRINSPVSQIVARWLLAFSWDTAFPIYHIYGHHKNIGTESDFDTARRNEMFLRFLSRSMIGQIRVAHSIERQRLSRLGVKNNIFTNKFYRGQLMSASILLLYISCLGWIKGLFMCYFAAAIGKLLLELIAYIEHYGLVRIPGYPIECRHSWDCYNRVSCYFLFNLPLHVDHHQSASRRFYNLRAVEKGSPRLPFGYATSIALAAFCPPIWRKLIHPLLADWDCHLASKEELRYLEQNNLRMSR
jgi:hypothetical protein